MTKPSLATRCGDCAIRVRAVCAYCDADELALLDSIKSYQLYPNGARLVEAGETTTHVGTIVAGMVKLSKTLPDGRRQLVGLQTQSDFVGGVRDRVAQYDAEACGEVLLCRFERGRFETLLAERCHLETRLLEMTLDELDAARDWLLLLGRKTAREKVASFLALLVRRGVAAVDLPLTRTEIADHLGLTLETVSRQMSKLKAEKIIAFEDARRVVVLDPDALMLATGDTA